MTIFVAQNLPNFRVNTFLRKKRNKFSAFLSNFSRNLCKTRSIVENVNFFTKHVIANLPKFTISAQNQTNEGLFKNYDYAALKSQLVTFS